MEGCEGAQCLDRQAGSAGPGASRERGSERLVSESSGDAHTWPPVPHFQASSPQDLRLFYEKNKTLVPP